MARPLIVFFLIMLALRGNAQDSLLSRPVSISFGQGSLEQAILKLNAETKVDFAYEPAAISKITIQSQHFVKAPLTAVLYSLFRATNLQYSRVGDQLVIRTSPMIVISGFVRSASSGEDVAFANVCVKGSNTCTETNEYGFFSLFVSRPGDSLSISHLGYQTLSEVALSKVTLNIRMTPTSQQIPELLISGTFKDSVRFASTQTFSSTRSSKLPFLGGHPDAIKIIQNSVGVKAQTEGSSGLFINGGDNDQNLVLLDEAMVYNPAHIFGLVSVFNTDALKDITLYKNYIPANFGGRVSSVIDTRLAEGNNRELLVHAGTSLLSSQLAIEGPVIKDKSSFYIAGRKSLIDQINRNFHYGDLNSSFYDGNMKLNFLINAQNRFFLSLYKGEDHIFSTKDYVNKWGNDIITARWNHLFGPRLFANLSAIYSNYSNHFNINSDTLSKKNIWRTGVRDVSIKGDFTAYQGNGSQLQFGFLGVTHTFVPGETQLTDTVSRHNYDIPRENTREGALYFVHEIPRLGEHFSIDYGIRFSLYQNTGPGAYYNFSSDYKDSRLISVGAGAYNSFYSFEPRIQLGYRAGRSLFHLAWNRNVQYVQLLENNELAFSSLETWIPASVAVKPIKSNSLFLSHQFFYNRFRFETEAFYKKLRDLSELIDHPNLVENARAFGQLRSAEGKSYGISSKLEYNTALWSTYFSYGYSKAVRRSDDINGGKEYPARYDIPNDLKCSAIYHLSKKISLSGLFNLTSGRPTTHPVGYYFSEGNVVPIVEERNHSRLPIFHHLDLNLQVNTSSKKTRHPLVSTLNLGVYNVYNRKNPLYNRFRQDEGASGNTLIQSYFGISPIFSYSCTF